MGHLWIALESGLKDTSAQVRYLIYLYALFSLSCPFKFHCKWIFISLFFYLKQQSLVKEVCLSGLLNSEV